MRSSSRICSARQVSACTELCELPTPSSSWRLFPRRGNPIRSRPMHLNVMTQCSPSPQFEGLWRHPDDATSTGYRSLDYWTSVARKLEAACIDALFFADIHGVYDVYRNSWEPSLRHAVQAPSIDPVLVVAAL